MFWFLTTSDHIGVPKFSQLREFAAADSGPKKEVWGTKSSKSYKIIVHFLTFSSKRKERADIGAVNWAAVCCWTKLGGGVGSKKFEETTGASTP